MKHSFQFKLLSDYVDGTCSDADRTKVESHLAQCSSCKKSILILKNAAVAMRGSKEAGLPADFDREFEFRLQERLKARQEHRFRFIANAAIERLREVLVLPAPVLARAAVFAVAVAVVHITLNYVIVEAPVISAMSGDVTVYSAKVKQWVTPQRNLRLAKGDIVNSKTGASLDIIQAGKYTVRVKENSRLTVARLLPKYVRGTAVYSISKGKAFVSIDPGFKGSEFRITTPEAKATAFGTQFLVNVASGQTSVTRLSVFEGLVKVESSFGPGRVTVAGGEMTEVFAGGSPTTPRQLLEKEWKEMTEFYQIGKRRQVALLVTDGKYRVRELLRPCPIFISDVEPRTISESLEETLDIINEAMITKDKAKHLEGIRRLEEIVEKYPNPSYEPQLYLFIGAYYNYLGMPAEAVREFVKVFNKYPSSAFASMALGAAGIVSDERLGDKKTADKYYKIIIEKYPMSPEAKLVREMKQGAIVKLKSDGF